MRSGKTDEKSKVLFIEPGVKTTKFLPIGIVTLAGFLRNEGHPVSIRDYSGKDINNQEIISAIKNENPKYVGIRVLTGPHIPRALKISKIAKQMGKTVIWGGPHPTILPEQTLENKFIDAVVVGEGEYALLDLIKYLEGKKVTPLGSGIKEKGKIKLFPPQKKSVNLEETPLPAWDLLKNINEYFPSKENNTFVVVASRGCPFKCAFCHNTNENVRKYLGCYRVLSAEKALKEYEFVQSLIKNKIGFLDADSDYHLVSKEYANQWCDTMDKKAPYLKWSTCARYSTIDLEMIDRIAKSNCIRINLGVESGSRRIQKLNNKVIELPRAIKIAKALQKRKIFLINTYIFGHPTETLSELKQTMRYIKKLPASLSLVQIYRPIPGTPYYDMCIQEKKMLPFKKLEDWDTFGIMKKDINVSRVPSGKLFFYFYLVNIREQLKEFINTQKYNLRNNFYSEFFLSFINNRVIKKLKEVLNYRN